MYGLRHFDAEVQASGGGGEVSVRVEIGVRQVNTGYIRCVLEVEIGFSQPAHADAGTIRRFNHQCQVVLHRPVCIGDTQFAIIAFLAKQGSDPHFVLQIPQGRGGTRAHRQPVIDFVAHRGLKLWRQHRSVNAGVAPYPIVLKVDRQAKIVVYAEPQPESV